MPNAPICRRLNTRPESKVVDGIGKVVLQRPNPVCQKEINEPYCGYCVWTTGEQTQYVGNDAKHLLLIKGKRKTWDTIMAESATLPAETAADLKAFAINACKMLGNCDTQISNWRLKLDAIDSIGAARLP